MVYRLVLLRTEESVIDFRMASPSIKGFESSLQIVCDWTRRRLNDDDAAL